MTKALMASVALAALALSGCATSGGGSAGGGAAAAPGYNPLAQYAPPPPAPEGSGTVVASAGGSNEALCASKGGIVGEWGGASPTKSCELPNGNGYPLADLALFPEFQ